jgi:hypothetical protein
MRRTWTVPRRVLSGLPETARYELYVCMAPADCHSCSKGRASSSATTIDTAWPVERRVWRGKMAWPHRLETAVWAMGRRGGAWQPNAFTRENGWGICALRLIALRQAPCPAGRDQSLSCVRHPPLHHTSLLFSIPVPACPVPFTLLHPGSRAAAHTMPLVGARAVHRCGLSPAVTPDA